MMYLLDTCVVSDFVKGDRSTLSHIQKKSPDTIAVSSITVLEIQYGLALNPDKANKIQSIMDDFLRAISILPFEEQDAVCAGKIRALLKQRGAPIGSYDLLLAGTALSRDLILITSNLSEFMRVDGLRVENWRESFQNYL